MSDLIRRTDVIDFLEQQRQSILIGSAGYTDANEIADTIEVLKTILSSPLTIKSVQQWIPCSERLPEESGEYLVWYDCGEDMEGCCFENFDAGVGAFGRWCDEYDAHTLGFLDSEFIYFDEAVAWMPLPEPMKTME